MDTPAISALAGFWKRLLAALIDIIVLGLVGSCILGLFHSYFATHDPIIGRLTGFVISFVYFALQNSTIGNGQTLGKRVCKIQVVGTDGNPISLPKAALRFVILFTPGYLNNLTIPGSHGMLWTVLEVIVALLLFGLMPAIAYLYIANHQTRQSVHDLAVGSYVRKTDTPWSVPQQPIRRIHFTVIAIWFLIIITALGVMAFRSTQQELSAEQRPFQTIYTAILTNPDILSAGAYKMVVYSNNQSHKLLAVNARYRHEIPLHDEMTKLAARVLDAAPDILGYEKLQVNVSYGIDIGIASYNRSYTDTKSVEEWKHLISLADKVPAK